MCESSIQYKTKNMSKVLLAIFFLAFGCMIYLLFRSKSINIYQWCSVLGLSNLVEHARDIVREWKVPEFIRFSLPDGLYCAAYILLIDTIWYNDRSLLKYCILSIVPVITICSELLQYSDLVRGTFDIVDLLCYMIPPTFYIGILYIKHLCINFKIKNL